MPRTPSPGPGGLIREWRRRRRISQFDLALRAEVSQRHLSFVESGRAMPSREMILRLTEHLAVPLRQRNRILVAAGLAPGFGERGLEDASLKPALETVRQVLAGHEPNPALAVDRHWNMILANAAVAPLLQAVADPGLLQPPANVLRLSLHPAGLAPHILNLDQWRGHLFHRLRTQIDASADPALETLLEELAAYPGGDGSWAGEDGHDDGVAIAVPLRLSLGGRALSFISTITVFGTPLEVTLSELAIETFFPSDESTAAMLRATTRTPAPAATAPDR